VRRPVRRARLAPVRWRVWWIVRHDGARYLSARGNSSRGIALTLSPGGPAARCGPVPPRTGHDV